MVLHKQKKYFEGGYNCLHAVLGRRDLWGARDEGGCLLLLLLHLAPHRAHVGPEGYLIGAMHLSSLAVALTLGPDGTGEDGSAA